MKLDMHCHSWYSYHPFWGHDCYSKPRDILKAAIKAGLDGISVTDHNTLKGSRAMAKLARGRKFTVVPGMEVKSTNGDILAYGIQEEIPLGLTPEETIEKILDQGGLPVIAHPFCGLFIKLVTSSSWDERLITGLSIRFKKRIGIEAFNSGSKRSGDERALALAEKLGLPKTAGSDSHITKSIGRAGIICDSNPLESLRQGRVKIFGEYNPFTVPLQVYWTKFYRLFYRQGL
jgi:predicted metal-dependent phosphoesterase TrpH